MHVHAYVILLAKVIPIEDYIKKKKKATYALPPWLGVAQVLREASRVRHCWQPCVTWLVHTCDMTREYVWQDFRMCVARLIHMCDVTHSYVWHDSFICVAWLIHATYIVYMCIHMCDMTH